MKKNFTLLAVCMTIVLGVFLGFNITSDPTGSRSNTIDRTISNLPTPEYDNSVVKFQDNMDGANDTTALHSRGYKTYYRGTGPQGLTATWFQPSATPPFPAFNGPTTGYAAANFNAVTGLNNIDSWLVLPALDLSAGDTLSFYANSTGSTWVDSVTVSYSAAGDSVPEAGSWVTLGKFKVNAGWALNNYIAPAGGSNARFAIRYKVVNGGPSGSNSDYMGIDAITVHGPSAPVLGDITAYAVDVRNGNIVRLNNCDRTIKAPAPGRSIFAGDFNGAGTWYGMQTDSLVTIDTTSGAITFLGLVTGAAAGNNLGMTWDNSTGTMYFTRSVGGTTLYTLNLTTRVATLVGVVSPTEGMIDIACSNDGNMYAWSLADSLYSVNKITGAATHIGPLGVNLNFAQGGDFDPASNTLILAGYIGAGVNNLYEVNLSTGAATVICAPPAGEYDGFAIAGTLTGVTPVSGNIPDRFTLSQNYPNPFNPTTKIRFEIPKQNFVSLKIYDMSGKQVASLVNSVKTSGAYEVEFNGSNLASGTYFYRIEAGEFSEVRKMVLIK